MTGRGSRLTWPGRRDLRPGKGERGPLSEDYRTRCRAVSPGTRRSPASPSSGHFRWHGLDGSEPECRALRVDGRWHDPIPARAEGWSRWRSDPVRDTRASGELLTQWLGSAVRGDDEIHVLTYTGSMLSSTNGGASWRVEQAPFRRSTQRTPVSLWTPWACPRG